MPINFDAFPDGAFETFLYENQKGCEALAEAEVERCAVQEKRHAYLVAKAQLKAKVRQLELSVDNTQEAS